MPLWSLTASDAPASAAPTIDRSTSCNGTADSKTKIQNGGTGNGGSADVSKQDFNLLIVDARSYTAAVGNRARGGGCECIGEY